MRRAAHLRRPPSTSPSTPSCHDSAKNSQVTRQIANGIFDEGRMGRGIEGGRWRRPPGACQGADVAWRSSAPGFATASPPTAPRLNSPLRAPFVPRRSLTPPPRVHRFSPLAGVRGSEEEHHKHSVFIKPRPQRGLSPSVRQKDATAAAKDLKANKSAGSTSSSRVTDQIVPLTHWPIRPVASPLLPVVPGGGSLPLEDAGARSTRRANEYVDSPSLVSALQPPHISNATSVLSAPRPPRDDSGLPELFRPHGPGVSLRDCHDVAAPPFGITPGGSNLGGGGLKASPMKSPRRAVLSDTDPSSLRHGVVCQEGIVCSRCGRCRCNTCAQPRELPQRWLGEHECSAACAVDTLSCMCCVRRLFHTRPAEEEDWSKEPCACGGTGCVGRWAMMSALALTCLPCLLCYWPLRCALGACTACYNSTHVIGCRCEKGAACVGTKALLTPESESSSY